MLTVLGVLASLAFGFYSAASGKFGAMSWNVISAYQPSRAFRGEQTQDDNPA